MPSFQEVTFGETWHKYETCQVSSMPSPSSVRARYSQRGTPSGAARETAGVQTAVRSDLFDMAIAFGTAFVLAFALIFTLFVLFNTSAAAAMRHSHGSSSNSKYGEIWDPYLFSIFDHGVPLVG